MRTLEAAKIDIFSQVKNLENFRPQKKLSENSQKNSIFCGSGDSLASCLLAEAYSGYLARALDPLDILKNPSIVKRKNLYIVSISGKTISNIRASKLAKRSIGITSQPQSKLANTCDKKIILEFENSDVFTAGTISFLDSALTCISLVYPTKIKSAKKIFSYALSVAKKTNYKNKTFFVGNLHTYPVALYAAAKIYEFLGDVAFYERIEQFSHMELFSINSGDTVVIFEEKNNHNKTLVKNLKKSGINVVQPLSKKTDKISQFLFFTFFSQLVPYFMAKKRNQLECHFVMAKKIRKVSDKMIY